MHDIPSEYSRCLSCSITWIEPHSYKIGQTLAVPCSSAHELTKYFVNPHEFAGALRLLFSEASLASAEINEQTNTARIKKVGFRPSWAWAGSKTQNFGILGNRMWPKLPRKDFWVRPHKVFIWYLLSKKIKTKCMFFRICEKWVIEFLRFWPYIGFKEKCQKKFSNGSNCCSNGSGIPKLVGLDTKSSKIAPHSPKLETQTWFNPSEIQKVWKCLIFSFF